MKLYHSPTSPYVRKVMVILHETGQLGDVDLVESSTSPISPAAHLLGKVPLAKIPALERDAGPTLFDSRVICAYLDDRAKAGLYGQGGSHWDILTLEALGDGITDAALSMTYENRLRPEAVRWADWPEGQWTKIARATDALESQWMGLLTGPLNAGQISVACALSYVDFRHGARNWRKGHEALADWFERFNGRDSMKATAPADP